MEVLLAYELKPHATAWHKSLRWCFYMLGA